MVIDICIRLKYNRSINVEFKEQAVKIIRVVQPIISVSVITISGFVGGNIAWLLESSQYDWEVRVALGAIFIGGLILGISLIIQCFFPQFPSQGKRQQLVLPEAAPSQYKVEVENEKFK